MENCPNCGAAIKTGLLSSNQMMDEKTVRFINEMTEKTSQSYCNRCGNGLLEQSKELFKPEYREFQKLVKKKLHFIPVISAHSPLNWKYQVVGMVTGQSTTGTGVFSEISSGFTDFFGMQSNAFNAKIRDGENLCFLQLRKKAIMHGANAVIATDIDYSEMGSIKGMIMVCMAGTAVKLENTEVLGDGEAGLLDLFADYENLKYLHSLKPD